jgi:hypothetical protein
MYGTAEHVRELKLVFNVYLKHPREAKAALTTFSGRHSKFSEICTATRGI